MDLPPLWTIGHSTLSLDEFLALLRRESIEGIADVRRYPGSRRFPHFGRDALRTALEAHDIAYVHIVELGGRRRALPDSRNTAWRSDAFRGYADYMETGEFRRAIDSLLDLASTRRTAIMCAEAVWWRCHRGLISDYLKAEGHEVFHIGSSGKPELHPYSSAARIVDGKLSYAAQENLGSD